MARSKFSKTTTEKSSANSTVSIINPIASSPLLEGEDEASFAVIRDRIIEAIQPVDFVDEMLVNDCVENVWETQRLRRLKIKYLQSAAHEGLFKLLDPVMSFNECAALIKKWVLGDAEAIEHVNNLLETAGMDREAIIAQTLGVKLQEFEAIERLIASYEARRQSMLREIERRRDSRLRNLQVISEINSKSVPVSSEDSSREAVE